VFVGAYAVFALVTVAVYVLPSSGRVKSRSLADASV
jgi:hypothetical protein